MGNLGVGVVRVQYCRLRMAYVIWTFMFLDSYMLASMFHAT